MSKGEKIGMTMLVVAMFGVWISASVMRFGFLSFETICITVMGILMLVMVWISDNNELDDNITKFMNALSKRRKVWRDMRDEDNPKRFTRRKKRHAFFERHVAVASIFIILLLEGAGWIWSMIENYHPGIQSVAFFGTLILFFWMCDQKYGNNAKQKE